METRKAGVGGRKIPLCIPPFSKGGNRGDLRIKKCRNEKF